MSVAKFKIKKGDQVIVRTGRDKGKIGKVLSVLREDNALLVEGINLVKRHEKPGNGKAGGIITKESRIHISNVGIVDPKENIATKVGYKFLEDGTKVRFAKKSNQTIG